MNSKQKINTETSGDISEHLNLNNIHGQGKAKDLLSCLVNAHFEEKKISHNSLLPKIILLGPTGKEAFAAATHNSLGNLNFIHLEASYLNCGGDDITDILKNCTRYDTVYISNASQLNKYAQNYLWKYLTCGEIDVTHIFEGTKETFVINDFYLILGTETLQGISKSLYNHFTHCILTYYAPFEIIEVLKQRCDYYKIRYTSEKVFEVIAKQVHRGATVFVFHVAVSKER